MRLFEGRKQKQHRRYARQERRRRLGLQVADIGVLAVTSQRIAYMGNKTIEMKYDKLMTIDVFSDGVRVHVSNRQNAPLFKVLPAKVRSSQRL